MDKMKMVVGNGREPVLERLNICPVISTFHLSQDY